MTPMMKEIYFGKAANKDLYAFVCWAVATYGGIEDNKSAPIRVDPAIIFDTVAGYVITVRTSKPRIHPIITFKVPNSPEMAASYTVNLAGLSKVKTKEYSNANAILPALGKRLGMDEDTFRKTLIPFSEPFTLFIKPSKTNAADNTVFDMLTDLLLAREVAQDIGKGITISLVACGIEDLYKLEFVFDYHTSIRFELCFRSYFVEGSNHDWQRQRIWYLNTINGDQDFKTTVCAWLNSRLPAINLFISLAHHEDKMAAHAFFDTLARQMRQKEHSPETILEVTPLTVANGAPVAVNTYKAYEPFSHSVTSAMTEASRQVVDVPTNKPAMENDLDMGETWYQVELPAKTDKLTLFMLYLANLKDVKEA